LQGTNRHWIVHHGAYWADLPFDDAIKSRQNPNRQISRLSGGTKVPNRGAWPNLALEREERNVCAAVIRPVLVQGPHLVHSGSEEWNLLQRS